MNNFKVKLFSTLHACKDYIQSNYPNTIIPIFSKESDDGKRFFFASPYDKFISSYSNMKPIARCYHEYVFDNTPCKLFMDIDSKNMEINEDEYIKGIIDKTLEILNNKNIKVTDLKSSRSDKISHHLYFNVICENIEQCKHIASHVDEFFPNMLDLSIYSNNRSLRIAYSRKSKTSHYLIPIGIDNAFNTQVMYDTFIMYTEESYPKCTFEDKKFKVKLFKMMSIVNNPDTLSYRIYNKNTESETYSLWSHDEIKEITEKLKEYIKKEYQCDLMSISFDSMQTIKAITSIGLTCPNKGSAHTSNKTYVTLTISFKGEIKSAYLEFRCADNECHYVEYNRHNIADVIFNKIIDNIYI